MIRAFRLVQTSLLHHAFDGEGARIHGGRWNSIGTPMVYCAQSLSLATLEVMAHAGDHFLRGNPYSFLAVEFPEAFVITAAPGALPPGWNAPVTSDGPRFFGDAWVTRGESVVLRVPSVITRDEWNYLLNPAHPDFGKLKIGKPEAFALDARLKKK